jgi:hypothetical protein
MKTLRLSLLDTLPSRTRKPPETKKLAKGRALMFQTNRLLQFRAAAFVGERDAVGTATRPAFDDNAAWRHANDFRIAQAGLARCRAGFTLAAAHGAAVAVAIANNRANAIGSDLQFDALCMCRRSRGKAGCGERESYTDRSDKSFHISSLAVDHPAR